MSSRMAAAAQIRRAQAAARRELEMLRRNRLEWLRQQFDALAAVIRRQLQRSAGADGVVPINALGVLRRQADQGAQVLGARIEAGIGESLAMAVSHGVSGIGAAAPAAALRLARERTLEALRAFVGADGLRLSDRVWRVRDSTRQVIVRALEQAITEGWSGIEAAQRLIGQGLAVTPEIRRAMAAAGLGNLERLMADVLLRNPGNPLAAANRLMTTEINRAYTEGFVSGLQDVPGIAGVRFLLSPRHPRIDICDLHAGVNLHGLGSGVYPLGQHPYPAHPQTLSYLNPVFADEIDEEDRAGQQSRSEWLRSQTPAVQDAILGKAKGNAFRAGHVPENGLRTPWRVLRQRLEGRGIDVTAIETTSPGVPAVATGQPVTALVSTALNVTAHKRRVRGLLDTIDQVHTDGVLPRIPVNDLRAGRALGVFGHTLTGEAAFVRVARSPVLEFALAHELGHFIDHQALGIAGRFASHAHPLLEDWRQAVLGSRAVRDWQTELAAALAAGDTPRAEFLQYLLSPHELWARTYAQYITVRSGSSTLAAQLAHPSMAGLHWADRDFAPIAAAIDALLRNKGWRP